jgi:hypothetical protein
MAETIPWELSLQADPEVLKAATDCLMGSPYRISEKSGGMFVLLSDEFRTDQSPGALAKGDEVVTSLNAVLQALFPGMRPIKIMGAAKTEGNVRRVSMYAVASGSYIVPPPVGAKRATHAESHPAVQLTSRLIEAAKTDGELRRMTRLLANADPQWSDLYRIYEIIEASMGGEDGIAQRGWMTKSDMERFRRTANHPAAAGDTARHGVSDCQPPAKPMPVRSAQTFIRNLGIRWIEDRVFGPRTI